MTVLGAIWTCKVWVGQVCPLATKSKTGDTIIECHATTYDNLPLQASAAGSNGASIMGRVCTEQLKWLIYTKSEITAAADATHEHTMHAVEVSLDTAMT